MAFINFLKCHAIGSHVSESPFVNGYFFLIVDNAGVLQQFINWFVFRIVFVFVPAIR